MTARNVLVIKLGAFGDLVLADGALRDLRQQHPQARITLLTRRGYAALMARCPWVDAVLADDNAPRWQLHRMAALRRRLHAQRFDAGFDLQGSRRSAFYRRWLMPAGMPWSAPHPRTGPVVEWHAAQLRAAGVPVVHTLQPQLGWIAGDVTDLLRDAGIAAPFVVLLPGSSAQHPHKRWPHYRACAQSLQSAGMQVVTIPGIDEPDIADGFPSTVLKDAGKPLDLHQLAGVLQRAHCVIGNDSGPTHLATSLGAPCVVLFAQGSQAVISTRMASRRCIALEGQPLSAVSVDQVVSAVRALLD